MSKANRANTDEVKAPTVNSVVGDLPQEALIQQQQKLLDQLRDPAQLKEEQEALETAIKESLKTTENTPEKVSLKPKAASPKEEQQPNELLKVAGKPVTGPDDVLVTLKKNMDGYKTLLELFVAQPDDITDTEIKEQLNKIELPDRVKDRLNNEWISKLVPKIVEKDMEHLPQLDKHSPDEAKKFARDAIEECVKSTSEVKIEEILKEAELHQYSSTNNLAIIRLEIEKYHKALAAFSIPDPYDDSDHKDSSVIGDVDDY